MQELSEFPLQPINRDENSVDEELSEFAPQPMHQDDNSSDSGAVISWRPNWYMHGISLPVSKTLLFCHRVVTSIIYCLCYVSARSPLDDSDLDEDFKTPAEESSTDSGWHISGCFCSRVHTIECYTCRCDNWMVMNYVAIAEGAQLSPKKKKRKKKNMLGTTQSVTLFPDRTISQ